MTTGLTATKNGSKTSVESILLEKLDRRTAIIPIVGETELIVHQFSEKEKKKMRDLQGQKVRAKKEPKDIMAEFLSSAYWMDEAVEGEERDPGTARQGFPAVGLKNAICSGARFFDGVTMTSMKVAVRVLGEGINQLVPLDFGECRMREDMVRVANGNADLRYRAAYWPWKMNLHVVYAANLISLEGLVNLTNAGGMGGIGEWRPSAPKSMTGIYGVFHVDEGSVVEGGE